MNFRKISERPLIPPPPQAPFSENILQTGCTKTKFEYLLCVILTYFVHLLCVILHPFVLGDSEPCHLAKNLVVCELLRKIYEVIKKYMKTNFEKHQKEKLLEEN